MKSNKILLFALTICLLIYASCNKSDNVSISSKNSSTQNDITPDIVRPKMDELACSVQIDSLSFPGTLCMESVGTSCKKLRPCTAIPTMIQSGLYTKEEIEQSKRIAGVK